MNVMKILHLNQGRIIGQTILNILGLYARRDIFGHYAIRIFLTKIHVIISVVASCSYDRKRKERNSNLKASELKLFSYRLKRVIIPKSKIKVLKYEIINLLF